MSLKKSKAPNLSGAFLNSYLSGKNSPMADQGPNYMTVCQTYDIDPRFLIAISGAETQFGINVTWGRFNAWNWGWNVKHQKHSPFSSWEAGMTSVAHNLTKSTSLYNLSSASSMYDRYCRGACTAGHRDLHVFMAELGADESALGFPVVGSGP